MSILVLQSSWWGRESWLLCLIFLAGVSWWLSGSSSWCHGVVCGLWLWYILIILTYYFCGRLAGEEGADCFALVVFSVVCIFLIVPWVGMQCVIVSFPSRAHLHFDISETVLIYTHYHIYSTKTVKEIVLRGCDKRSKHLKTFELHNSTMWPFSLKWRFIYAHSSLVNSFQSWLVFTPFIAKIQFMEPT